MADTAAATPSGPGGFYLDSLLAPLAPWLERPDVTDIYINHAQELWIETLGGAIETHPCPALTEPVLARLSRQIAAASAQGISREHPLLAASLPDGSRVQIVAPPATRAGHALAIRRHVAASPSIDDYEASGAFELASTDPVDLDRERQLVPVAPADVRETLREGVRGKRNLLISGGTSTGKTTFLNAMLGEIPREERVVLVEDTPELKLPGANGVGLVAVKGELGEAKVTANELLQSALRLRPDRIVLGELRGAESVSFLRAINTGHPGSFSTIHANSLRGALEQLALMVMQTGIGLTRSDTIAYAASVIDVIVQLDRSAGKRGISAIARSADLL